MGRWLWFLCSSFFSESFGDRSFRRVYACVATVQKDLFFFFFLVEENVGIPSHDDFVQLCGIHYLRSAQ